MKGTLQILDGHPVPYSLTTQIAGRSVPATPRRKAVEDWLARNRPGQSIQRIDGAYVFYSRREKGPL